MIPVFKVPALWAPRGEACTLQLLSLHTTGSCMRKLRPNTVNLKKKQSTLKKKKKTKKKKLESYIVLIQHKEYSQYFIISEL